jgi:hypothetical protein
MARIAAKWCNFEVNTSVTQSESGNFTAEYGKVHLVQDGIGPVAVSLPAHQAGGSITIKALTDEISVDTITITPGAGNIEGAANLVLSSELQAVKIVSDGTNWHII